MTIAVKSPDHLEKSLCHRCAQDGLGISEVMPDALPLDWSTRRWPRLRRVCRSGPS
jgi:hypothetical protein